jgi:hypothetical protein
MHSKMQGEVERLLKVVRHRVLRLLEKRGALPAQGPEDALQAYQAHSLQQRLRWTEVDVRPPPRKQPRCAFLEGFSLHANTHLHANDRQGLERLCRYGARGALALERLSRAEDGRIAWRMKRPLPDGTTHLLFLVPPPRANLTRFVCPKGLRPSFTPWASTYVPADAALGPGHSVDSAPRTMPHPRAPDAARGKSLRHLGLPFVEDLDELGAVEPCRLGITSGPWAGFSRRTTRP